MTETASQEVELSCYTTNLVTYLGEDARDRLAAAVRLRVRVDLPTGVLAFSHHDRIDQHEHGWQLGYRGSHDWSVTRHALAGEVGEHAAALAVGNTRHLPWAPQYGKAAVPHWILVEGWDGTAWRVSDNFTALLPDGHQHRPYSGQLDDAQLRDALTPTGRLDSEVRLRDEHALGAAVTVPATTGYRWLAREPRTGPRPPAGTWLTDPTTVLTYLADRMTTDHDVLRAHCDDLWAAARHHRYRLALLAGSSAAARSAATQWGELPRLLRFAVESTARGRSRTSVVTKAFANLVAATSALAAGGSVR